MHTPVAAFALLIASRRLLPGVVLHVEPSTLNLTQRQILSLIRSLIATQKMDVSPASSFSKEVERQDGKLILFTKDAFEDFIFPLMRLNYYDAYYKLLRIDRSVEIAFLFCHAALRKRWCDFLTKKKIVKEEVLQKVRMFSPLDQLEDDNEAFIVEKVYRTIILAVHDKVLNGIVLPLFNTVIDDRKAMPTRRRVISNDSRITLSNTPENQEREKDIGNGSCSQ